MIRIVQASRDEARSLSRGASAFWVDCELVLAFQDGLLSYEVVSVSPYEKSYPPARPEAEVTRRTQPASFLAYIHGEMVGQIVVSEHWNGFASVNHIAVEGSFRRRGVGTALLERAISWSTEKSLHGVMVETQNNNIAACKLYERGGFRLRGFDQELYRFGPHGNETALFWYWHPKGASTRDA